LAPQALAFTFRVQLSFFSIELDPALSLRPCLLKGRGIEIDIAKASHRVVQIVPS
jgi:hypothetical protein